MNEEGPISYTMDNCIGNEYAIMGFIQANEARKMMKLTKDERMRLIAD